MSELRLVSTTETFPTTPPKSSARDSFSITAIGSCRIVGPLRLMQKAEPVSLNQSGVYGYSHTSTELRQHLAHLLSGTRPPKHLMPVLAPSSEPEKKLGGRHKPSDFYVFELSSAKRISVEDHPVQLNYLNRHFQAFFSEANRTRAFWEHAKRHDGAAMKDFLKDIPEYCALPEADQRILRQVQLHETTPDLLRRDIDAIRTEVPDHLFVTHFDALAKDGKPLKARAAYLKMVRAALIECNATWYDPTESIAAFGQHLALDDPDKSLSHFSHSFERFLSNNWWLRFVQPLEQERRMDAALRTRIREAAEMAQTARNTQLLPT